MTTSIGFSFRFVAAPADAGGAGIGGEGLGGPWQLEAFGTSA
jgi:hypothetical protein